MHDPFPFAPPEALAKYVEPIANYIGLRTLPLHFHEVTLAFTFYHVLNKYISPALSNYYFPRIYPALNQRTKVNWDVHIVSFVQSTVICVLALYVMWTDRERAAMNWEGRVWGYTGGSGLIQAFAGGYFVWDLMVTLQNVRVFGPGMLAHAVSALFVFSLGFRPFVNFYAPTFILYELSSPFLNIHWFCDKLNMTGTKLQFYNGITLLLTFFSCRLLWGSYQSIRVFYDVYRALVAGHATLEAPALEKLNNGTAGLTPESEIMRFGDPPVPMWLAACYLASNFTLNGLNWYWFGQMISALRKRFDPPFGTRVPDSETEKKEPVLVEGINVTSPPPTPSASTTANDAKDYVGAVRVETSGNSLKVAQSEIRNRTTGR
ncbi:DUF887-domain-containing protein [Melanomma pulvis-pyrius CBS 109.77]|uniref:DUF887-domain-containing protein n=1 Tax=Melanomma pulvis-pyrius CBS 109.77 TaxID=1314802 RepID=A0A6A6XK69_9PLEO|nr:DUF887-domain-containing protein [Melanomma pulvis-pyrius CBS 109.77]